MSYLDFGRVYIVSGFESGLYDEIFFGSVLGVVSGFWLLLAGASPQLCSSSTASLGGDSLATTELCSVVIVVPLYMKSASMLCSYVISLASVCSCRCCLCNFGCDFLLGKLGVALFCFVAAVWLMPLMIVSVSY